MRKHLGIAYRRMLVAVLLASSLGTAAFAFNATVHAKSGGCCLLIASCIGNTCNDIGDCVDLGVEGGFCCDSCD